MKMIFKIAIPLATCLFSAFAMANNNHCGDGSLVFYGKTLSHNKSVEVCKLTDGYNYKFGKSEGTPDINITVPVDNVELDDLKGYDTGITTIAIPNGNVKYKVGYVMPEGMEGRYEITVWQNEKKLALIKLDKDTVTNNIVAYANSDDIDSNNNSDFIQKDLVKLSVSGKYKNAGVARYYFWKYQIISKVDNLKIDKITVNRGRCHINESKRTFFTKVNEHNLLDSIHNQGRNQITVDNETPRTDWELNYGGVYYFTVSTDSDYGKCKPLNVVIETNQGNQQFEWEL